MNAGTKTWWKGPAGLAGGAALVLGLAGTVGAAALIQKPGPPVVQGSITAMSGGVLTVTAPNGTAATVDTSTATAVRTGPGPKGQASGLGALAVGEHVVVFGTESGGTVTATAIVILPTPPAPPAPPVVLAPPARPAPPSPRPLKVGPLVARVHAAVRVSGRP